MMESKKILLFGGSGLVGSQFIDYLKKFNFSILAPDANELNALNFEDLKIYINDKKPDILVNLIAHTNLDEAEKERDNKEGLAWKLNVLIPKKLAEICKAQDIFLLHISTDAIFPGSEEFKGPYKEDQIPNVYSKDLSWYGETKRQGEIVINNYAERYAIVRIDYPFGNADLERDFAKKTYSYILAGYPLFVDQIFNPTYLPDLNAALKKIIEYEKEGIFHVATKGLTTPYDFGKLLVEIKGLKTEIKKGSAKEFMNSLGKPARPLFGGLDIQKTEEILGLEFHNLEDALREFSENIS